MNSRELWRFCLFYFSFCFGGALGRAVAFLGSAVRHRRAWIA